MSMNAKHWALALGAVLLASPAAWASDTSATVEHSGTVTAVDSARNTITIEEMGPWHPGKTNLQREVFAMRPEATVELARRGDVAGGFPGQWGVEPLAASAVRPGDYATLTSTNTREDGRRLATKVVVVRPGGSDHPSGS